jgi:hypothetical protein
MRRKGTDSLRAVPVIPPVQYLVDGDEFMVCHGCHTIPEQAVNGTIVAFAANRLDSASGTGWTVQLQGTSRVPNPNGVRAECGQPGAGPLIRVEPITVSGHHVRLCPFGSPVHNRP